MKDKLAKLIDVKSILTLVLLIVFSVLCLRKDVPTDNFVDLFKLIIIFYFGTQAAKAVDTKKKEG